METDYAKLIPWVEQTLGGRVVSCDRQGARRSGGRPAFFIDVETPHGLERCYARMHRGPMQSAEFSLAREFAVLEELARAGIAAPRPLGFCPDPEGILLERLAGEDDYCAIRDPAQQDAIDRAFVAELAKLHALPTAPFVARGLALPRTREEFALGDLASWERGFEASIQRPVPVVSFMRNWLHRNLPKAPARAVVVQGDTGPGQFMFEGQRLTGIVDWEFAHLGDPMLDLGLVRGRDFYNPGADLRKWFALYEEFSGTPIDVPRLRYYTVKALIITPLALAGLVQRMPTGTDHAEWYAQYATYTRATLEALAEAIGIALENEALPALPASPNARLFDLLDADLRDQQQSASADDYQRYRVAMTARLSVILRNADAFGRELRERDRDDQAALLGHRPATAEDAELALERLVQESGARREAELLRYFHRQARREEHLLRGALGAGEHSVFQRLS
jgi:aminoglycoside phosphotransferase (APT) family kinase protein